MGRVERKPVVRDGQIKVGEAAPLFVRADHRVVSAYQLAEFTETLRQLLIDPSLLEATDAGPATKHTGAEAA
jgi:pyruvate/2-oxoglutarate dehydrogenase complex dihydrolipoamide acyltransferase (E2) component